MKNIPTNWQQQALKEFEARKLAEKRAHEAIKIASETQELFKKTSTYKNYLESKYYDLEALHAEATTKLENALSMLKKAKQLILQRKEEIYNLQNENNKLKKALTAKTELLNTEMQQNEELNHKIAKHLSHKTITAPESFLDDRVSDIMP